MATPARTFRCRLETTYQKVFRNRFPDAESLEQYILDLIQDMAESVVANHLGVEYSFGRYTARGTSPLQAPLREKAMEAAQRLVGKVLAEQGVAPIPSKMQAAILRAYRDKLEECLLEQAEELARTRAEQLRGELLDLLPEQPSPLAEGSGGDGHGP